MDKIDLNTLSLISDAFIISLIALAITIPLLYLLRRR